MKVLVISFFCVLLASCSFGNQKETVMGGQLNGSVTPSVIIPPEGEQIQGSGNLKFKTEQVQLSTSVSTFVDVIWESVDNTEIIAGELHFSLPDSVEILGFSPSALASPLLSVPEEMRYDFGVIAEEGMKSGDTIVTLELRAKDTCTTPGNIEFNSQKIFIPNIKVNELGSLSYTCTTEESFGPTRGYQLY